jgi:hypothetical protein
VALGGYSRISLVNYRTGAIRQRLFGHGHEITGLAFSPDGGTLASCSMDGTIKLWNLQTMQEVCTIPFDVKPALGKEIGVQGVGSRAEGQYLSTRQVLTSAWRARSGTAFPRRRRVPDPDWIRRRWLVPQGVV